MSINVNSIALPPTVVAQVVTAIQATDNETATRQAVIDPTGLLLAYKTINKSFGNIYFNNSSVATTISTANTLVLVQNSAFVLNSLALGFSLTAGTSQSSSRLTYNGTSANPFRVSCTCNVMVAGSNNQSVTSALFLNGVAIPSAVGKSWIQTNNQAQNNAMVAMLTLNPNDYVEMYVANGTANNNVTVIDCTLDAVSLH